jgi:4-amino-4-deoxy-L-arabinose transferase-like glycosyltransferase
VVALLLITLLGLVLRLYRLDAQSLWYDEGFSVYLAGMDLGEITARTAVDIQPPLYYYLLHGWIQLFGDSEWAVRSLSVLFGTLAVPLIYAVAWELFRRHLAGLLVALLLAVSPLQVWYAQETRMYTLLVFLSLLSTYLLLAVVNTKRKWAIPFLWGAYALCSVAALYTHYFAFFVLAVQGIYVLLVWVVRGCRPMHLLWGGLASGVAVILGYVPWLPYLANRYAADMSYWPGQLKIHEVMVDIGLSFVGGESVSEPIGILLAIGYGAVLILCLLALLAAAAQDTQRIPEDKNSWLPSPYDSLLFLLLYLLLPPALILALSYNAPKFNARYVMISYPALLLIVAGGTAVLWQRRTGFLSRALGRILAISALFFLLGVSAYADFNAYTNPAFTRDDFRGAVGYVRQHVDPSETIILVSGHMFPVFDYYAPGVERYLLPDSPTLDISSTLDLSIAGDLNRWLGDEEGVWLVLWQDEVVDPMRTLETMLADAGEEQPVEREFPGVKVRHYRLPENAFLSDQPVISHPVDFNFGNRLRLHGYRQTSDREVILFWEALQPLEEDYRVSLTLRDTAGQSWGQWDRRPTAYQYPTNRWQAGQIVFGRYDLKPMPGTPPGDYGLEVGVYTEEDLVGLDLLDKAGAPQGKRAMLGGVRVSVPAVTPDQIDAPHPDRIEVGDGLALLGWDVDKEEAQPGDQILLTLIWSVESKPANDYWVRVFLQDAEGQALDTGVFPLTNRWHPTTIWLPGQAWRGQSTFRLPIELQPGEANLAIQLVDLGGALVGPAAELTKLTVLPTTRVFTPPQPQSPRGASFADKILLLGADLGPDPVARGAPLEVILYWKALAEMDVPYTVFVHLLDPSGQVAAGHDGVPADGTRPTTGWVPGEFITDVHSVSIPADLVAGEYVVEVGLYDAGTAGLPRLPIVGDEGQAEADRVIFGPVEVQ